MHAEPGSSTRLIQQALGWALLLALGACQQQPDVPAPVPPVIVSQRAAQPDHTPRFSRVDEAVSIRFQRDDDIGSLHRIQESTGGGVAIFDYDLDGWADLFFTDGRKLPRSEPVSTNENCLFRNHAGVRFAGVAAPAGLVSSSYGQGCAVGDFDGDGFDDLYVCGYGPNFLWQNNGDGTFTDATPQSGTSCPVWSTSAAFGDFNRDGQLDLYVVNYLQAPDDPPELCRRPNSPEFTQCPPTMFPAENDVLYVSRGDGTFSVANESAGITGADGKGLGVVVFDMDHDSWPDIYVANDGMPNFLYMNTTGTAAPDSSAPLRFENRAFELDCAVNDAGVAESSMGIACGDYDGDGWADLFVTNYYREVNALYRNLRGERFRYETHASGLGPPSRDMLGWGTEFFDADNDGWLDLFVANGHVDDPSWKSPPEPYEAPAQMFQNLRNGRFAEVSEWAGDYFREKTLGRGMAVGDLDRDGDLDIAVSNQLSPSAVLRNESPHAGRSVMLRLIGRGGSNRSAYGTRLETAGEAPTIVREVIGGASYQSSSDRRVHIGLGDRAALPEVRIAWPSGQTQAIHELKAGEYVLVEGAAPRTLPR